MVWLFEDEYDLTHADMSNIPAVGQREDVPLSVLSLILPSCSV
jgi:hypothetical protein